MCNLFYGGAGKVSIHSSLLDALVYVDGEKVGVINKKSLLLILVEMQCKKIVLKKRMYLR